jgi:hypothetical protein
MATAYQVKVLVRSRAEQDDPRIFPAARWLRPRSAC